MHEIWILYYLIGGIGSGGQNFNILIDSAFFVFYEENSAFRYGGARSRDRQQGKGPYTPWEVVKMSPKQVLTSTNHFLAKFYPILI